MTYSLREVRHSTLCYSARSVRFRGTATSAVLKVICCNETRLSERLRREHLRDTSICGHDVDSRLSAEDHLQLERTRCLQLGQE